MVPTITKFYRTPGPRKIALFSKISAEDKNTF